MLINLSGWDINILGVFPYHFVSKTNEYRMGLINPSELAFGCVSTRFGEVVQVSKFMSQELGQICIWKCLN